MVRCQRQQHFVHQNNVLEVVYDALAVEEIHSGRKPVPVQALGRLQVTSPARNARDGDDFFEGYDLNSSDDGQDVDVTHKERREETSNHDEGPERSRDKGGLLFLVLGILLF